VFTLMTSNLGRVVMDGTYTAAVREDRRFPAFAAPLLRVLRRHCALLQFLNVGRGELRAIDSDDQFVDFSGEVERDLVVLVIHAGARV